MIRLHLGHLFLFLQSRFQKINIPIIIVVIIVVVVIVVVVVVVTVSKNRNIIIVLRSPTTSVRMFPRNTTIGRTVAVGVGFVTFDNLTRIIAMRTRTFLLLLRQSVLHKVLDRILHRVFFGFPENVLGSRRSVLAIRFSQLGGGRRITLFVLLLDELSGAGTVGRDGGCGCGACCSQRGFVRVLCVEVRFCFFDYRVQHVEVGFFCIVEELRLDLKIG